MAAVEHMNQFDRMRYRAPSMRRELLDQMIDQDLLLPQKLSSSTVKEEVDAEVHAARVIGAGADVP